jgi:hypothetical protein
MILIYLKFKSKGVGLDWMANCNFIITVIVIISSNISGGGGGGGGVSGSNRE